MTDDNAPKTIIVGGRVLGFTPPTQGQLESMIRIARSLKRGTDDDAQEFWEKQIVRVGTLLESLIDEGDREILDDMYLTGKIDSNELMTAILATMKETITNDTVKPAKKANAARVRK